MYTSYFGFTKQPFTGPDTSAFLTNPAHEAAYTCLHRHLAERRGLVLLTGTAGTGKTTLLHRLMGELHDQCIFLWNAHLGFDDLLNYLCDTLGLSVPGGDNGAKLAAVEVYLIAQLAQGQRVVLVLDDAQNLPEATLAGLERLTQLQTRGQRLLPILLSGQPCLEARLRALAALRPALEAHCRLEALSDEAVVRYIRERLRAAGHSGEGLFEAEALRKAIAYAHGVPRLINLICNQALLLAYLNSEQRVRASMVREVASDSPLRERVTATIPSLKLTPPPAPSEATLPSPQLEPMPATMAVPPVQTAEFIVEPKTVPHHTRALKRRPTKEHPHAEESNILKPPFQPSHRRWPWITLGLLLVMVTTATVVALRHPNISSELDRLFWSLDRFTGLIAPASTAFDKPNTMHVVELPLPIPNIKTNATAPQSLESTPAISPKPPASPPPSPHHPVPDLTLAKQIETLLTEAQQQLAVLRYTFPAGANALDSYRKVLELDPDNSQAQRGIERIKLDFVRWSTAARTRGDWTRAQSYLETASSIDPNDAAIGARLEALRRERPDGQ